jgi:hypothetical protein
LHYALRYALHYALRYALRHALRHALHYALRHPYPYQVFVVVDFLLFYQVLMILLPFFTKFKLEML